MRLDSEINKHIIHKLEQERDMYKRNWDKTLKERDTLNSKLNQSYEDNYKLEGRLHDMTKQRDTLIDDLAVLKANISRLEREDRDLKHENKALRLQSNTYFDEWQESEKQRNEFISHINLYTTLTNHIRMKAEMNPGVSRYIDLVNYIDRLERKE